jgi:hypothetical protein
MYKLPKTYLNEPSKNVIRIEDEAWIPVDESNTDYQAYLKWLELGNTPLPAGEE